MKSWHGSLICLSLASFAVVFGEESTEASPRSLIPIVKEKSISIVKNLATRLQDVIAQVEALEQQFIEVQRKNLAAQVEDLRLQMRDFQDKHEAENIEGVLSQLTTNILKLSKQLETEIQEIHQKMDDLDEKKDILPIHESLQKLFAEVDFIKHQLTAVEEKYNTSGTEQILSNVVLHLKTAEEQIATIQNKIENVSQEALTNLTTEVNEMKEEIKTLTQQIQGAPTAVSVKQLSTQVNNVQNELKDLKGEMQIAPKTKIVLDNATTRGRYGGFITGEWLFWQFYEGGTDFAATYDTVFTDASNKSINFNWASGFRVGIGGIFARDDWDLYASYTQITDKGTKTAQGNLFPLLLFQPNFPRVESVDYASSHFKIEFRNADLDLGREFFVGNWLSIHPAFGLKAAWIDQHADINYCLTTPTLQEYSVELKNNFSGIGPSLGLGSNWFLCRTFSLYADLAGALLWGEFSLKQEQESNETETVELKSHLFKLVPSAQIRVGFLFDAYFNRNRNHFGINLGWEMQYWWRQNQIERFIDSLLPIYLRESDDLSMQGLTLGLRFDF